jgi:hypothetical protein
MTAHADAVNLARRLSSRQENDLLQTNLYGKFRSLKKEKVSQNSLNTIDANIGCIGMLLVFAFYGVIRTRT